MVCTVTAKDVAITTSCRGVSCTVKCSIYGNICFLPESDDILPKVAEFLSVGGVKGIWGIGLCLRIIDADAGVVSAPVSRIRVPEEAGVMVSGVLVSHDISAAQTESERMSLFVFMILYVFYRILPRTSRSGGMTVPA